MSYKKVGGIHFIRVWRFGFNFYVSKTRPQHINAAIQRAFASLEDKGIKSRLRSDGQRVIN